MRKLGGHFVHFGGSGSRTHRHEGSEIILPESSFDGEIVDARGGVRDAEANRHIRGRLEHRLHVLPHGLDFADLRLELPRRHPRPEDPQRRRIRVSAGQRLR